MLAALHIRQIDFGADARVEVALAWLSGEEGTQTAVFTSRAGDGKYSAALDAFGYFVSLQEGSSVLYISNSTFRREIQAAAASFPGLDVAGTARGRLHDLIGVAVQALDDHTRFAHRRAWAAELTRREALPELIVATDASKATGRNGAGVAYVSAEGGFASKVYPEVETVLAGELLAIALALKHFPERRLHVLTDSKAAIASLTMSRAELLERRTRQVVDIVDVVQRRTAGRDVRYSWVRSHAGHELNEIADRLAVAARRNREARVSPSVKEQINRNIIGQLSFATRAA